MKLSLLTLSLMMVGCLKPVPPAPEVPQVVVVKRVGVVPPPIVISEDVGMVDEEPPVKTWMLQDEIDAINQAREHAEKYGQCYCQGGDPACECIP